MNFTKEILLSIQLDGIGEVLKCNFFTLSNSSQIIGQFVINKNVGYYKTNTIIYKLVINKHWLKGSRYEIFENENKIGSYEFSYWKFINNQIGQLVIGDKIYYAKRLKHEIKRKFFDKSKDYYFKYELKCNDEFIVYDYKVTIKGWFQKNFEFSNCEGKIEYNIENIDLSLFGFLFLEKMLNEEDYDA